MTDKVVKQIAVSMEAAGGFGMTACPKPNHAHCSKEIPAARHCSNYFGTTSSLLVVPPLSPANFLFVLAALSVQVANSTPPTNFLKMKRDKRQKGFTWLVSVLLDQQNSCSLLISKKKKRQDFFESAYVWFGKTNISVVCVLGGGGWLVRGVLVCIFINW